MKKISVIIPCYNAVKYLPLCMESLEKQTIGLDTLELIFVNDASTDNTSNVLHQFEQKYPETVLVIDCEENHHQGGARNIGIAHATADYIAFQDDDDVLEPTMLQKLYEKAVENQCDLVVCRSKRQTLEELHTMKMGPTGGQDQIFEITNNQEREAFIKRDTNRAIWNKLYKRTVITDNHIQFPEHMIYDDIYFSALIKHYVKKIYLLEEYLYHHLVFDEAASMSGAKWEHKVGYFDANVLLIKELRKRELYQKCRTFYEDDFFLDYFTFLQNFIKTYGKIPFQTLKHVVEETVQLFPYYYKNERVKAYLNADASTGYAASRVLFLDFSQLEVNEGERIEGILIGNPAEQQSFIEGLNALISLLQVLTLDLLKNQMKHYNGLMKELSDLIGRLFPIIITSYSRAELRDYAEDALYWSNQLKTIIEVLESKDHFKIADVLYYETRENLIIYKNLLEERRIAI